MPKRFYIFLLLFGFLFNFQATGQAVLLSDSTEVSVLTVGPGEYLYDKFGHSAFRIKDASNNLDLVYNYGTYDFNTPIFYTKFAQGKLLYKLSINKYQNFYRAYVFQDRWIKEQVLDLTYDEKVDFFNFLQNNALPQNCEYKYDFFYDNCATRIRDVIAEVLKNKVTFPENYIEEEKTFRQLIQQNVTANSCGSLGMDVAIGAVTDVKATEWQYQFLPDYVFKAIEAGTISNGTTQPLVKETRTLFENKHPKKQGSFFTSPLFVFGILGLLLLWITYRDYKKQSRSRFLDSILFFSTGLIGVFLLLLWFATDHSATAFNYNLLWAFPLSLFLCVAIGKKKPKKWLQRYVFFLLALFGLILIHSISGIQQFAIGFIPLFISLVVRYLYVFIFLKKIEY